MISCPRSVSCCVTVPRLPNGHSIERRPMSPRTSRRWSLPACPHCSARETGQEGLSEGAHQPPPLALPFHHSEGELRCGGAMDATKRACAKTGFFKWPPKRTSPRTVSVSRPTYGTTTSDAQPREDLRLLQERARHYLSTTLALRGALEF
jgi:hypothetical protein